LFSPPFETPVKTLDLPIAGKITSSQSLPLILDLINIVNNIPEDFDKIIDDDLTGEDTIRYLNRVRKIVWRINSIHLSSLGLHPIIYFYTLDGRHKPTSFYAIVSWIMEMENKNNFKDFINVRKDFEKLLIKYDYLIQDINRQYRQGINSYIHIKDFINECIINLKNNSIDHTIKSVISNKEFNYLKLVTPSNNITSKDFTDERKSAVYIKEAIQNGIKCAICNGYISKNSITIDHIVRKEDGGAGSIENGQIAHPYCNSTVKN
jgi:hypothetical protein